MAVNALPARDAGHGHGLCGGRACHPGSWTTYTYREAGGLLGLVRWYEANVRGRALDDGAPAYLLLDEIHKLRRWHEEVKHLGETFPCAWS